VDGRSLLGGWPSDSALIVRRVEGGDVIDVASEGDVDLPRQWASVSKVAVAYGFCRGVSEGRIDLTTPAGPPGASLAHLLAHASGLGLESSDRTIGVGERRVYSNVGIDLAVAAVAPLDPSGWLEDQVFAPLKLAATLQGRPAAGVEGSLEAISSLGVALLAAQELDTSVRDDFVTAFMGELAGIVPGFGRFDPCPWGLGVEVHGAKHHWMGSLASSSAYGHFGQSGTLVLIDPIRQLVVAAAASEPFGPWARERWPQWMDEVVEFAQ
jgi:CubicO group peptidase (beta-lactamase class C family)